jgi:hypothetical protein
VRWGPNRRKEAWASGSPRGVNDDGVSAKSGRKEGGKTLVTGNGPRWSPEEGGGVLVGWSVSLESEERRKGP